MPADLYRSPIPPQLWSAIREEFGLPTLAQVQERLEAGLPDPELALRQLVRVIGEGTFWASMFWLLPPWRLTCKRIEPY